MQKRQTAIQEDLVSYLLRGIVVVAVLTAFTASLQADPATTVPNRQEAFFRKNIVDAYEQIGSRNPKWDGMARQVLQLAVLRWKFPQVDPDIDWRLAVLGNQAIIAGCDDSLVLYHTLRARGSFAIGFGRKLMLKVADNASDSHYAPFLKVFVYARAAPYALSPAANQDDATRRAESLRQAIYDNLPGALADPDAPGDQVADICVDFTDLCVTLDGDRKPAIDKVYAILSTAQPNSPVADLFKSMAYRKYAWDARGNGFAGTVTASGWNLFAERLAVAKDACDAALVKDPHCSAAAAEMIHVQLGLHVERAEMEAYFNRAIADDPHNYDAYDAKLYYLTPKWHGRARDQLEFGKSCLATKQWDDRIPFLLLQSHRNLVEARASANCAPMATTRSRGKRHGTRRLRNCIMPRPTPGRMCRACTKGTSLITPGE